MEVSKFLFDNIYQKELGAMTKYYNELVYYVQRMIGDKEKSTNIIQETYLKTIEKSKTIEIKNERAFLYKVARNLVVDKVRKREKLPKVIYEEAEHFIPKKEQPKEIALINSREDDIKTIIENLPLRSKQAFVLHIMKGYSRKKISEIMGISVNAVQKHITRGIVKVKEQIDLDEWELYD